MKIEINEKELLAIKAVKYGCETNKRLIMSSYLADVTAVGTEQEQSIGFGEAINIVTDLGDWFARMKEGETVYSEHKVIAWMPLPMPYKKEGAE